MSFVKINTIGSQLERASWENLGKLYHDLAFLKKEIWKITSDVFGQPGAISGKVVLFKPNWVTHNTKDDDEFCLRTNSNFLIAAIEVVLECKPQKVIVGDAPIQGCNWARVVDESFLGKIDELSARFATPIEVKDFRRTTFEASKNISCREKVPLANYVIFDLGKESFLEPISSKEPIFRVTNYDSAKLAESHTIGKHKYCLAKELFDCEVIISLPKIKTHQKTGLTGALKNLVGLNGDKDYLPHHRVGGTGNGGDCYPGKNVFRRISEFFLDQANKNIGKILYWPFYYGAKIAWRASRPEAVHQDAAGWHGNDTCWRMVMDLNKIAVYGSADGRISNQAQRKIFSLCDGIVGGQGNGPLIPQPLPLGIISFCDNSGLNDVCMATIMGFNYLRIPLLKFAYDSFDSRATNIFLNSRRVDLLELKKIAVKTLPPPGWVDYLRD